MGISFGKGSASRTEFHSFIEPAILHITILDILLMCCSREQMGLFFEVFF